ncbi:hypothetical protein QEZ54_27510 [Catellatospora sp. KI3]|uniref:hypothetical protein n=1 Tax=Catellatospora sp. KI3 TaxID=3041620 RepID=UPI002482D992|nr:hypothetical protein [Catellatospora sp. KI3]MDI1464723.1 hypothetical protein [Catellatospora sp. KI3]
MSALSVSTHPVLVTGDQTIDWAIVPKNDCNLQNTDDRPHTNVDLYWHKGGIFQLKSMINAAINGGKAGRDQVHCAQEPELATDLTAYGSGFNHSISTMRSYSSDKKTVFRLAGHVGFRRAVDDPASVRKDATPTNRPTQPPRIIVIDDADLGFRRNPANWRDVLLLSEYADDPPWVLLKMSFNIVEGGLWEEIKTILASNGKSEHAWLKERLIILTSAAKLRDAKAEISRNLSWERSAYDTITEVELRHELKDLTLCPKLVVSFGPSGALLLQDRLTQWQLIHRSSLMEGEWRTQHDKGMMFGYGGALCACLVRELSRNFDAPRFADAVKSGLVAMQRLYDTGFDVNEGEKTFNFFPSIFRHGSHNLFDDIKIPDPSRPTPDHNRVKCPPLYEMSAIDDSVLMQIARSGKRAVSARLPDVPLAKFGKLITVDREEIEGLHAIDNLVQNHLDNDLHHGAKPLAIAVFGCPGSGKGFAVEELFRRWSEEKRIASHTFNLSQMSSPDDLIGALHQIRDIALSGVVPVALWDEFDSPMGTKRLGWLRYFLAPIQDGNFNQGETVHRLGPAVFVFIGGTSKTFADFKKKAHKAAPEYKAVDFISRIRGYIDIASVDSADGSLEPAIKLRRALTLHALFEKYHVAKTKDSFDVDDGVLAAFLTVARFEHGVRSMDAIIQMSTRGLERALNRSSLPSQEQINLHVNGRLFFEAMRKHQNVRSGKAAV